MTCKQLIQMYVFISFHCFCSACRARIYQFGLLLCAFLSLSCSLLVDVVYYSLLLFICPWYRPNIWHEPTSSSCLAFGCLLHFHINDQPYTFWIHRVTIKMVKKIHCWIFYWKAVKCLPLTIELLNGENNCDDDGGSDGVYTIHFNDPSTQTVWVKSNKSKWEEKPSLRFFQPTQFDNLFARKTTRKHDRNRKKLHWKFLNEKYEQQNEINKKSEMEQTKKGMRKEKFNITSVI